MSNPFGDFVEGMSEAAGQAASGDLAGAADTAGETVAEAAEDAVDAAQDAAGGAQQAAEDAVDDTGLLSGSWEYRVGNDRFHGWLGASYDLDPTDGDLGAEAGVELRVLDEATEVARADGELDVDPSDGDVGGDAYYGYFTRQYEWSARADEDSVEWETSRTSGLVVRDLDPDDAHTTVEPDRSDDPGDEVDADRIGAGADDGGGSDADEKSGRRDDSSSVDADGLARRPVEEARRSSAREAELEEPEVPRPDRLERHERGIEDAPGMPGPEPHEAAPRSEAGAAGVQDPLGFGTGDPRAVATVDGTPVAHDAVDSTVASADEPIADVVAPPVPDAVDELVATPESPLVLEPPVDVDPGSVDDADAVDDVVD